METHFYYLNICSDQGTIRGHCQFFCQWVDRKSKKKSAPTISCFAVTDLLTLSRQMWAKKKTMVQMVASHLPERATTAIFLLKVLQLFIAKLSFNFNSNFSLKMALQYFCFIHHLSIQTSSFRLFLPSSVKLQLQLQLPG